MKITFYDTHGFDHAVFEEQNKKYHFEFQFLELILNEHTALLAKGSDVICAFVNDKIDERCLEVLHTQGVKMVAMRSAGINNIDLKAAQKYQISVTRVPGYSPNSIAEFSLGILLCLNRKIHKSYMRVKELNFSLDGLIGFDLQGKTVGVIGTGKIGSIFARVVKAMGCKVLAYDNIKGSEFEYVELEQIFKQSDIISLHIPLTPETKHIINAESLNKMKKGVYIINTSRGALIDTKALITKLKDQTIGGVALDVYEEEENFFFRDLSEKGVDDDILARLLTFPNVLITSHQAFLTKEALQNIAETTLKNINEFRLTGTVLANEALNH